MRDWINVQIDRLQETFPPNRLVALLTPVFASLAGFIASWTAENFPGLPPMDENWLAGIFIAGAFSAIVAAFQWIDGWQKYEARQAYDLDPDGGLSLPASSVHPSDETDVIEEEEIEPGPSIDDPDFQEEIPRKP